MLLSDRTRLVALNLSNDPEQQYFADGVTGDLTTDLSRIPDMLVISEGASGAQQAWILSTLLANAFGPANLPPKPAG